MAVSRLIRGRSPDQRIAEVWHVGARNAVPCRPLYLRGRPALQLEDAVPVMPPPRASVAAVAATRRDGVWPFDADVRLIKVQRVAPLLTPGREPEPLKVELMEEREPVVHLLERQVFRADPRAFVEHSAHPVARPFPLRERRDGAL